MIVRCNKATDDCKTMCRATQYGKVRENHYDPHERRAAWGLGHTGGWACNCTEWHICPAGRGKVRCTSNVNLHRTKMAGDNVEDSQ
jgi:hypothetical protein